MKHTLLIAALWTSSLWAQNAAVSSYLDVVASGDADIRIRDVRMPSSGFVVNTYWCTLGYYTTDTTSGYGGMQWTSDTSQGPRNLIYSQWNNYSTSAYNDPNTAVTLFGGEGTGVKSIYHNPNNQWQPDYWHTTADRVWHVGSHSYFALIFRNGQTKVWKHLMTWDTPNPNLYFSGGGYTFLEDWTGDGNYRESNIRKGWQHLVTNPSWFPITTYNYSVNSGDIATGGRSVNKSTNWKGGTASDSTGSYFYMGAGGNAVSTNNSGINLSIARSETTPQQEYGSIAIQSLSATTINGNKLVVNWNNDSTTVPQWAYKLIISQGSDTLITKIDTLPQGRTDTLALGNLNPSSQTYTLTLTATDFFNGSAQKTISFGGTTAIPSGINPLEWQIQSSVLGPQLILSTPLDQKAEIGVYNLRGDKIWQSSLGVGSRNLSIPISEAGSYIISINLAGQSFHRLIPWQP